MLSIIFGVPGSGKTTAAARIVYKNSKKHIITYSNVPIKGARYIDLQLVLGNFDLGPCDLIIDEASIEFNNRKFKELSKTIISWLKLYRHHGCRNIYVFSQSYDDMDITLRRLADILFTIHRPFRGLHVMRLIYRRVGPDPDTHKIEDSFFFRRFGIQIFFGRRYYKLFDSWEAPSLPPIPDSLYRSC